MQQLYIGWRIKGFKKFYELGQRFNLSPEAQYRLTIIGYYFNQGNKNASCTVRHFGIHRNTVMKWISLYNPNNLHALEPEQRAPIQRYRKKTQENIVDRIIYWKNLYPYMGKTKICRISQKRR